MKFNLLNALKSKKLRDMDLDIHISLKNKYVYFMVCKAASSTVTYHLQEIEYLNSRLKVQNVNNAHCSPHVKQYQLDNETFTSIMNDPEYKKITVVRNPFDRLLSCYLHRIVGDNKSNPSKKIMYKKLGIKEDSEIPSFSEFIDFVTSFPDLERHWAPQYKVTLAEHIDFDYIGQVETLDASIAEIRLIASRKIEDELKTIDNINLAPKVTRASSKVLSYYTPELVAKVTASYQKDFEMFGYSKVLADNGVTQS